jgi:citrate lyase subunit beta/citryl-CoA lyase
MTPARPRRSLLFMPGSNQRAMEKARGLDADGLVLDLEDSVPPERKDEARRLVTAALADGGFGQREVVVRVNGADTAWIADDLAALRANPPDAILIPKIYDAGDLTRLGQAMDDLGFPGEVAIWAMMETPAAILNAQAIASTTKSDGARLQCLVMGVNDLASDLHAQLLPGRASMLTSLGICLLAARAAGVAILDSVFADLKDASGLAEECRQGRELGFDGKTLIHPGQIAAANEAFGPSADEIAEAGRIIAAFEAARAEGKAVTTLDGRMIEELHAAAARQLLALQQAIERQK